MCVCRVVMEVNDGWGVELGGAWCVVWCVWCVYGVCRGVQGVCRGCV